MPKSGKSAVMTSSPLATAKGIHKGPTIDMMLVNPVLGNRNKRSMDYEPDDFNREFKRRDTQVLGAKGLQRVRFILLDEKGQQSKRIHIFKFLFDRDRYNAGDEEVGFDVSRFKFERMLEVIGMHEETVRELQYSALLPCRHVIDVSSKKGWKNAIKDLDRWMSRLFVAEDAKPVILGPSRFVVREDTPEPDGDKAGLPSAMVDHQIPLSAFTAMLQNCAGGLQDLDLSQWKEACEFFCHPVEDERGVKIPGMGLRIPPKIMYDSLVALRGKKEDASSSDVSRMNPIQRLCLLAIQSLCWTVSDMCSATHTNISDAEINAFEQDYHIQCYCRSQSLKDIIAAAPKRGLHAIVAAGGDEMKNLVQGIEILFNDKLPEMFKHCMLPMTFKGGKLTNIFPDYGVDPVNVIAQQRSAGISGEQSNSAGGLERVVIIGLGDLNRAELWELIFPCESLPLDMSERSARYSEVISEFYTIMEAKNVSLRANGEVKLDDVPGSDVDGKNAAGEDARNGRCDVI